jgi:tRNA (adenine22-N1)-methyltransferase
LSLPPRLRALLELAPAAVSAADVGSGHGALAAALAERGVRVVAVERTVATYAALRADLGRYPVSVEARQGEGLEPLTPGEVELVVVAGMGGRTIRRILDTAPWLPRWLLLQPVQDPDAVAAWLSGRGWTARETLAEQGGRGYRAWLVEVPAEARGFAA